jgi:hypothetical protein
LKVEVEEREIERRAPPKGISPHSTANLLISVTLN